MYILCSVSFNVKPSSTLQARASFFCLLLDQGVVKQALPELCQDFEVATAWTSFLVSLFFSHQTGFF